MKGKEITSVEWLGLEVEFTPGNELQPIRSRIIAVLPDESVLIAGYGLPIQKDQLFTPEPANSRL
ncbi:MAG: hypothetical protein WBP45_14980 [Daejeonella sp.]